VSTVETKRRVTFTVNRFRHLKDKPQERGNAIAEYITGVLYPVSVFSPTGEPQERVAVATCFYDKHAERWQLGCGNDWWMRLEGDEVALSYRYGVPDEVFDGLVEYLKWRLNDALGD
jgi:hypothetical protein